MLWFRLFSTCAHARVLWVTALPKHLLNDGSGRFSELSLSKELATQARDHPDKNKENIEQKQEKNSVQTGEGNLNRKKNVAAHESAAESEEIV